MSYHRPPPGPAAWEQVGFDLWDVIAAIADRNPRDATTAAKAALYAVRDHIEKGSPMPSTKAAAPARNKELVVKLLGQLQQQRDKDEATGDTEGAALLTQVAAFLLKYAGVADEPTIPSEQLNTLKRLAAVAAFLLKYAGVADEPTIPSEQLNTLKRLAATTDDPRHREHYTALAKVEDWKHEY